MTSKSIWRSSCFDQYDAIMKMIVMAMITSRTCKTQVDEDCEHDGHDANHDHHNDHDNDHDEDDHDNNLIEVHFYDK